MLLESEERAQRIRVLSSGLAAAGELIVASSGEQVFFTAKRHPADEWQIYETALPNGQPRQITRMPGGATSPALLRDGSIVYSSPVLKSADDFFLSPQPALFAQKPGGSPHRLTFGSTPALDPTALSDGRILFVSPHVNENPKGRPRLGLFTINSDGTELTAFALDHDGLELVRHPRELMDGRVTYIAQPTGFGSIGAGEVVRKARPFQSRSLLFPFSATGCSSVEPEGEDTLLVCAAIPGSNLPVAVYRSHAADQVFSQPLFRDPAWQNIEAVPLHPRLAPMGHVSAILANRTTGTMLCLDANFTRPTGSGSSVRATRVRVLAAMKQQTARVLGEITLQSDGSFLAEVPADIPVGFESLDSEGHILHRLAPSLWLRPGENRSCVGCHEPANRSPRNIRPLALLSRPSVLKGPER